MYKHKLKLKQTSGMAAIITVVIISAVALIIIKSISLTGIDSLTISYQDSKAGEALAIAEGCAEEAFRRVQLDPGYVADDLNLNIGSGICILDVAKSGDERTALVTGNIDNFYKKIQVVITKASGTPITVDSWEEVSE